MNKLAKALHELWSHWTRYMFDCTELVDEAVCVPNDKVLRWVTLMNRDYEDLSREERQSDLDLVRIILENCVPTVEEYRYEQYCRLYSFFNGRGFARLSREEFEDAKDRYLCASGFMKNALASKLFISMIAQTEQVMYALWRIHDGS